MSSQYFIYPSRRLVLSIAVGTLERSDLLQHAPSLQQDPRFDPSFAQFVDFRPVTEVRLSGNDVKAVAETRFFADGVRRVILAEHDFLYGMARLFQMRTEDRRQHLLVTRSAEEAWEWLGIPDDAPERAEVEDLSRRLRQQAQDARRAQGDAG